MIMENFISVAIPSRKVKKAILERMLQSVNIPLNEKKVNYGIFEGDNKNIILKLEIPKQLSEKHADNVAHKLSEGLFDLGYNDFDIEISTDGKDKGHTLENTNWHVNTDEVDEADDELDAGSELAKNNGAGAELDAGAKKVGPVDGPKVAGVEPGSEQALMAIVARHAKPGMTLADVDAMERAAVASEVPSAADDANIFSKAFAGFKRFAKSKSWRVSFVLANAAEQQGLPGLYNSKGYFVFMGEASDDGDGNQSVAGPKTAAGASLKSMMKLAKLGLVPQAKLDKIQKAFANQPENMKIVTAIVTAQNAATSQVKTGPVDGPAVATDNRVGDAGADDAMTAANQAKDRATDKFANMSPQEINDLAFSKMKRLDQLLKANPEARTMQAESMKKVLRKKLHNNYIFEDAAADKEIAELVADLELLLPKLSAGNARVISKGIERAKPYVRRHKAITTSDNVDTTNKDEKICAVGNPLAIFAKSGKGGLKNDPDEIAAVKELQKYLGVSPDGTYGSATKSAVTAYQKQHGLKVDSDAGPETIGHMMKQCKDGKPTFAQAQDNNPNKGDGGGPAGGPAIATDTTVDDTIKRPKKSTSLTDGVAPAEEQTNPKVIKFNWKKNSYYIDVIKITVNIPENKIVWTFYKDEGMANPQKVDILAQYWVLRIEAELVRRGETGALKIIAPITQAPEGSASSGIDGPEVTGQADLTGVATTTSDETDPKVDAILVKQLYDSVNNPGTDEDALFAAIAAIRDNAHYKIIARMFKKQYPDEIGEKYPTLAIWMREDLDGWILTGDDLKKFDSEMKRLGVDIKKPIPAEKIVKGETVKSGGKTVIGTGEVDPDDAMTAANQEKDKITTPGAATVKNDGAEGYYRIPDAMREELGLDPQNPKYAKLELSPNGKVIYIRHNADGSGSGPRIAVDSKEGKKLIDFLKGQGAEIIDPSGKLDQVTPDGKLDNEPNAGDGGGELDANDSDNTDSIIDDLAVWDDDVEVADAFANFDEAFKARDRLTKGDMVLIGDKKALCQELDADANGETLGIFFVQDKDGTPFQEDSAGPASVAAVSDNKKIANTSPNAGDGGGAVSNTDKSDKTDSAKDYDENQLAGIKAIAQKLYDTNGYLNDDEKGFKAGFAKVKTLKDYKALDKAFMALEDNDDKESIEEYAIGMLNGPRELETYYYSELRRIKVPHNIDKGDLRRLEQMIGKRNYDKGIAPFYDEKGNFIMNKGTTAK